MSALFFSVIVRAETSLKALVSLTVWGLIFPIIKNYMFFWLKFVDYFKRKTKTIMREFVELVLSLFALDGKKLTLFTSQFHNFCYCCLFVALDFLYHPIHVLYFCKVLTILHVDFLN